MIAAMNLANYVAILMSGITYGLLDALVTTLDWPRSSIFGFMSLFILPLLLWYKPNFSLSKPISDNKSIDPNTGSRLQSLSNQGLVATELESNRLDRGQLQDK